MHCQKPAGCDKHFCYDCGGKYDAGGHHTCKYVSTAEYACSCASSRRLDCPNRSRVHNTSTLSAAPCNGRCCRSSAVQILCFVAQHSVGVIRKSYARMAVCAAACGARTLTVARSRTEARGGVICMPECCMRFTWQQCALQEVRSRPEARGGGGESRLPAPPPPPLRDAHAGTATARQNARRCWQRRRQLLLCRAGWPPPLLPALPPVQTAAIVCRMHRHMAAGAAI